MMNLQNSQARKSTSTPNYYTGSKSPHHQSLSNINQQRTQQISNVACFRLSTFSEKSLLNVLIAVSFAFFESAVRRNAVQDVINILKDSYFNPKCFFVISQSRSNAVLYLPLFFSFTSTTSFYIELVLKYFVKNFSWEIYT